MSVIKQNSKYVEAMALTDSAAFVAGELVVVWKDEHGRWITKDSNGKKWHLLTNHLRNDCFYKIIRQSKGIEVRPAAYDLMYMDENFQTVFWDFIIDAIENSLKDCGQFFSVRELHDHIVKNYI